MAQKSDKKTTQTTEPTPQTDLQQMIGENTKITLTIPWKDAEPAYKSARAKVAKTLKTDGFRKGKVPAELAEKLAGTEKIIEEALQVVVPPVYQEVVTEAKKQPLTYPEFKPVSVELKQDWIIEAFIAERPEIKLKDYKKTVKTAIKEADKKIKETEEEHEKAHKEGKHAADHDHNFTDEQKKDYRLQHIYQAMVQETKPVIPELLIKHEVQADLDQLAKQLSEVGLTFEEYMKRRNLAFEQLSQEMTINALGKLQVAFLMDAVAQDAKITIESAEIDTYIKEKVDAKVSDQFTKNPEYRRLLANTLLRQKIADYLLAL
ncbi:MAG: Trigger factor [Patescibacteria group bacterium]|jgi:trigger factor|nr:Trigger factor [Patescibacteria group bacterium]